MTTQEKVNYLHKLVASHGHVPMLTLLYGSQNYGLDTEASDVDVYSFVLPSKEDLYRSKRVSTMYKTEYGNATVKDLRDLPILLSKMNPSMLEVCTTDYFVDPLGYVPLLKEMVNDLVKENQRGYYNALNGTILQKYKDVSRASNLSAADFAKHNYSVKDFVHYVRLCELLDQTLVLGKDFDVSLKNPVYAKDYKFNILSVDAAAGVMEHYKRFLVDHYYFKVDKNYLTTGTDLFKQLLTELDDKVFEDIFDQF